MIDQMEVLVCNLNTLQEVRKAIEKRPKLGEAFRDSLDPVKTKLGHRFQTMKLKGTAVKIGVAATESELTKLFDG